MNTQNKEKKIIWQQLQSHYQELAQQHLESFFINDEQRFNKFSVETDLLFLDYSKNHLTEKTIKLLCQLANSIHLKEKLEKLFNGEPVNFTEKKPALHTALRDLTSQALLINGKNINQLVSNALARMQTLSEQILTGQWLSYANKPFTDVVNIGIGGSDLGPLMVTNALKPYCTSIRSHFVANVDGTHIYETLKNLNPETTLFIIASKSFKTAETLLNGQTAKQWLTDYYHCDTAYQYQMIATSQNKQAVLEFGILEKYFLPLWDWIGGRFSVWSTIGFPIMLAIGYENFVEFLEGAYKMDQHFKEAPFESNMPVLLALIGIWYNNFFEAKSHLILPYDQYLQHFSTYVQQLDMESNGKQINCYHETVAHLTSPIIWGQIGCIGQHSFHQFLYQGTQLTTADFICPIISHNPIGQHHSMLFANCISQAKALMCGKSMDLLHQELIKQGYDENEASVLAKHKSVVGNRPSNMLLFKKLTPETLGSLIALYEHKVFVQGCIWEINSFDQWGVDLGKEYTKLIFETLANSNEIDHFDCSTNGLINYFKKNN